MTSAAESMVGRRVTEAEYLSMPDEKPYLEYCDGILVQKAMPNRDHFRLAHRLDFALGAYSLEHGGEAGPEPRVRFAFEGRVFHRLPDVAYWAPGKPIGPVESMLPPTLAIEVRSPDESMAEQREKCRFYRAHGVEVAWLVDPGSRTMEVFEGDGERTLAPGDTLTSAHLPGFALGLAELFATSER